MVCFPTNKAVGGGRRRRAAGTDSGRGPATANHAMVEASVLSPTRLAVDCAGVSETILTILSEEVHGDGGRRKFDQPFLDF